jgi:hypothetical protein
MPQRKSSSRRFARRLFGSRRFKKRYDVLNHLAWEWGYEEYLEIGMARGRCLERVRCARKSGVDPDPLVERPEWSVHKMTSEEFFEKNETNFDLVLIDGLHLAEQVLRDVFNSLSALSAGGAIVLHDCSPRTEDAQLRNQHDSKSEQWNGDVWKSIVYVRQNHPELFCHVLDLDHGVGVILPMNDRDPIALGDEEKAKARELFDSLSWSDLVE